MNKEALINAGKEFFRVIVLAIIPVVIAGFESGVFDLKLIATIGAVAGLRFIDKYLHELGLARSTKKEESALTLGLTRF